MPVFLLYAGILHAIGLALLLPMLITLPGPAGEPAPAPAPASAGEDDVAWAWPIAAGQVLAGFDEQKNKGIDIGGRAGEPVLASADGKVVYAGAGLRGYGNLIILKHNNTFLTAYAHKVHQPRPKMADIAQAQNASPQAVTGRYSAGTLGAIEGALRVGRGEPAEADDGGPVGPPDFSAALRHAFPSLTEMLEADDGHSNLEEWFRTRLSAVEKHEL